MSDKFEKKIVQHPSLSNADEMKAICKPLEKLNINYFSQVRVSNDKRYSVLSSNPSFLEHYLRHQYYDADINMADHEQVGSYVLWDALALCGVTEKLKDEATQFGVKHTFTIIKPGSSATDYFHFSSDMLGPSINNDYLRHLDLLERFTNYFKDSIGRSPLKKAHQENFQLELESTRFSMLANVANAKEKNRADFLALIENQKGNSTFSRITKRQRDCLNLYVKGYTTKNIASQLGLSHRTVENYLQQVKEALCVSTKAELILLAIENNGL
jgi:DNA-binding CsgD family transcriptional regulator